MNYRYSRQQPFNLCWGDRSYKLMKKRYLIVWRKKIGIHQGSSINNIFASQIGVEKHDYAAKTRYAYRKYQAYLTGREVIA